MKPDLRPGLVLVAAALVAVTTHVRATGNLAEDPARDYRPLPARYAKLLATDFDALWADMAWLAFLQHDGAIMARDASDRRFGALEAGLQTVTTLDPDYLVAYVFGSWALGDADRPQAAQDLLERGLAHRPGDRQLLYQLGFVRFLLLRDLDGAISAFMAAAAPGAHPQDLAIVRNAMKMAAGLAERRNDPNLAGRLWRAIAEDARRRGDDRLAGVARRALERLRRERASVTAPDRSGR
ncbi:MAG: hypothetical protein FJY99_04095 [Candidatus Sericytochromatia bacterium]|nr:hypothetical protein [Candidatus Tanganyikabacteria bacterium]